MFTPASEANRKGTGPIGAYIISRLAAFRLHGGGKVCGSSQHFCPRRCLDQHCRLRRPLAQNGAQLIGEVLVRQYGDGLAPRSLGEHQRGETIAAGGRIPPCGALEEGKLTVQRIAPFSPRRQAEGAAKQHCRRAVAAGQRPVLRLLRAQDELFAVFRRVKVPALFIGKALKLPGKGLCVQQMLRIKVRCVELQQAKSAENMITQGSVKAQLPIAQARMFFRRNAASSCASIR